MNIICENCKAPYKGSISPHSKFVECQYCKSTIKIQEKAAKKVTTRRTVLVEEEVQSKEFDPNKFKSFLTKRNVTNFDPVSGIVRIGNQEVVVNNDGSVTGSGTLKSRVEKWVHDFMTLN